MDSKVKLNSYSDVSNRKLLGGKLILAVLAIEYYCLWCHQRIIYAAHTVENPKFVNF